MKFYSEAAMERAMAKRITWWQAAEIFGMSCRSMRRWKRRYEQQGYDGLYDRRGAPRVRGGCRWRPSSRCWSCIGRSILTATCGTVTRSCGKSTGSD